MRDLIRAAGELLASLPPQFVGLGILLGIAGALTAAAVLGATPFL